MISSLMNSPGYTAVTTLLAWMIAGRVIYVQSARNRERPGKSQRLVAAIGWGFVAGLFILVIHLFGMAIISLR